MEPSSAVPTLDAPSALSLPPAWRVELYRRPDVDCPEGTHALAAMLELGVGNIGRVRHGRGYLFAAEYTRAEIDAIVRDLLLDPVLDEVRVTEPSQAPEPSGAPHRILVAPRPGVMDPVALQVAHTLGRTGHAPAGAKVHVASFRTWEIYNDGDEPVTAEQLTYIGRSILANETIEVLAVDREELPWSPGGVGGAARGPVEVPLRALDDGGLQELSTQGELSLNLVEMRSIQAHFEELGREPLACELETIAQTWSEHCKHKTLTGIVEMDGRRIDNVLKSTIARATHELDRDFCVSVFVDNAGIVSFAEGWDVCIKVETHNHPSAIDPYGGAGTGIGGVIRDILGAGLGAKPIANTDCFFVGPTDLPAERVPKGTMHPRRILRGVVAGVRDYGNRMGIPTVNGGVWFHEGYTANPLVYAGTVGLIPAGMDQKEVRPGDKIVTVGGRTGRDGIHGATFSSAELHEDSETVSSSAVQIGDPITEKRVLDGLLVARDRGLYRGLTDCGAGGFSSAVGEMAEKTGADVDLSRVPLKYEGLASHEIWISEAQERMVLSVPPEHLDECLAVFAEEDVEATVIGEFTDTGRLIVRDEGQVVCDLAMSFLHDGTPRPVRQATWEAPQFANPGTPPVADPGAHLLELLRMPDIASKAWIIRQYDHEVQGHSVVRPLVGVHDDGPGDAAVVQPLPDVERGLAIACGTNPHYGLLDPGAMTLAAIDEALRNAVAVGADPDQAAILDNFSWGNCDKPDRLGGLVRAAEACYDAAIAYRTPFISGKDSLNNEYRVGGRSIPIPPTLLITAIAPVPSVRRALTMDLKSAGNTVYLVGTTGAELGGSHTFLARGIEGGTVPVPDLERAPALLRALHAAFADGLARACHDLSEGGLAVAAAEMAFAGDLGLDLRLADVGTASLADGAQLDDSSLLFSESCTRFLVEVEPEQREAFEAALAGHPCSAVGTVTERRVLDCTGRSGAELFRIDVDELRRAHGGGFRG